MDGVWRDEMIIIKEDIDIWRGGRKKVLAGMR